MKREIIHSTGESNRSEYREVTGGRKRYWDKRFCEDPTAIAARDCLIELRKQGENFDTLGVQIGVSSTTISRVAGGNAGLIPQEKFNGRSTTEYVVDCLKDIIQRKSQE